MKWFMTWLWAMAAWGVLALCIYGLSALLGGGLDGWQSGCLACPVLLSIAFASTAK